MCALMASCHLLVYMVLDDLTHLTLTDILACTIPNSEYAVNIFEPSHLQK